MSTGSSHIAPGWFDAALKQIGERCKLVHTFNVPLGAGISNDSSKCYLDRSIPQTFTQRDGKLVRVFKYVRLHEFVEKQMIDAGIDYTPAHAIATAAETAAVKADGFDAAQYAAFWDHYLPIAAKHKLGDGTPPDIEMAPYGGSNNAT